VINVEMEALASRVKAAGEDATVHFIKGEALVRTTTACAPG